MSDYNEILKYIKNTPENTNPAIIKSMLDNYDKPAQTGIPVGNTVNIINNSSVDFFLTRQGSASELMDSNGFLKPGPYTIPVNSQLVLYAFTYFEDDSYDIMLLMFPNDEEDNYFVTVNNDPCTYTVEVDGYSYTTTSDEPINGQTYNIIITDKIDKE